MERKINIFSFKNILIVFCIYVLFLLISCEKTEVVEEEITPSLSTVKIDKDFCSIINPKTHVQSMIRTSDGKILLTASEDDFIGEIQNYKTNKTDFLFKSFRPVYDTNVDVKDTIGDNGVVNEFYDTDGKKIGFSVKGYVSPHSIDGKIYYDDTINDNIKVCYYDANTKQTNISDYDQIEFYNEALILSNYLYDDDVADKNTYICNYDFSVKKQIDGWNYSYTGYYNGLNIPVLIKKDNDNVYYNFLTNDFNLFFEDEQITGCKGQNDSFVQTLLKDDKEFDFDFSTWTKVSEDRDINDDADKTENEKKYKNEIEKLKQISPDYYDVQVIEGNENGNLFPIFLAYYSKYIVENDHFEQWVDEYNSNLEKITTYDYVSNIDKDKGTFFANHNEIMSIYQTEPIKEFSSNCEFAVYGDGNNTIYANMYDENYYVKENFNIYDRDFNEIISNVDDLFYYSLTDYIIVARDGKTEFYDKNFNLVKTLDEELVFDASSDGMLSSFYHKNSKIYGIMDKSLNILVDDLLSASDLQENYFTYMKGFKFGLMDYEGKIIYSYSVFDDIGDDDTKTDYSDAEIIYYDDIYDIYASDSEINETTALEKQSTTENVEDTKVEESKQEVKTEETTIEETKPIESIEEQTNVEETTLIEKSLESVEASTTDIVD